MWLLMNDPPSDGNLCKTEKLESEFDVEGLLICSTDHRLLICAKDGQPFQAAIFSRWCFYILGTGLSLLNHIYQYLLTRGRDGVFYTGPGYNLRRYMKFLYMREELHFYQYKKAGFFCMHLSMPAMAAIEKYSLRQRITT